MTLVSEFRLMSLSVLYDLMYPVSVLTNVLSILDTFNTGVTGLVCNYQLSLIIHGSILIMFVKSI